MIPYKTCDNIDSSMTYFVIKMYDYPNAISGSLVRMFAFGQTYEGMVPEMEC